MQELSHWKSILTTVYHTHSHTQGRIWRDERRSEEIEWIYIPTQALILVEMPTLQVRETKRRYEWPELQLNIWIVIVLVGSSVNLGVFSWFMTVQTQMMLGIPWWVYVLKVYMRPSLCWMICNLYVCVYACICWLLDTPYSNVRLFPYMVTVGSLGVAFIITILFLAAQRFLLPGIIILGSFIMWVLSLTGMIETALQMFGGQANVNSNCQNYVTNQKYYGNTLETLAWLTQNNICE